MHSRSVMLLMHAWNVYGRLRFWACFHLRPSVWTVRGLCGYIVAISSQQTTVWEALENIYKTTFLRGIRNWWIHSFAVNVDVVCNWQIVATKAFFPSATQHYSSGQGEPLNVHLLSRTCRHVDTCCKKSYIYACVCLCACSHHLLWAPFYLSLGLQIMALKAALVEELDQNGNNCLTQSPCSKLFDVKRSRWHGVRVGSWLPHRSPEGIESAGEYGHCIYLDVRSCWLRRWCVLFVCLWLKDAFSVWWQEPCLATSECCQMPTSQRMPCFESHSP